MKKSLGSRAAILMILAGGLGVGVFASYVARTPEASRVPNELRVPRKSHEEKPIATAEVAPRATMAKPVAQQGETVRLPAFGDDISDMDLLKEETTVPAGEEPMRFVAQRIVDAAHFDGVKVAKVEMRDHVAVVHCNEALQQGMGSMEEGAFLRALQLGLGQFSQVDGVMVEAGGKPLESGHVDLTSPLSVIRPGQKAPSEEAGQTPSEP